MNPADEPAGATADAPATSLCRTSLFLIPVPLGADSNPMQVLPPATVEIACRLRFFIAESARSARAVLGALPLAVPIQDLSIQELNRNTPAAVIPTLLAPLHAGHSVGVLSEAGCPAIADPGSAVVALAHRAGIPVVPLVGPSAILLALMASGMNGQQFAFAGYLPVDAQERLRRIRQLERRSAEEHQTQLLIETPYRNQALFDALLETLSPETELGVASALTLPSEAIAVRRVSAWRSQRPTLPREPAIFSFLAAGTAPAGVDRRGPVADAGRIRPGAGSGTNAAAARSRRRR